MSDRRAAAGMHVSVCGVNVLRAASVQAAQTSTAFTHSGLSLTRRRAPHAPVTITRAPWVRPRVFSNARSAI